MRVRTVALAAALLLALSGCSVSLPMDPDGTLDRVSGGVLRVGYSVSGEWVTAGDGDVPGGIEPELVERFADEIDASIIWSGGGEEKLMGQLERDQLDLVIGGITDETPWVDSAAITKPFAETSGPDGRAESHVMAAQMGENAFLLRLERFLLSQESAP